MKLRFHTFITILLSLFFLSIAGYHGMTALAVDSDGTSETSSSGGTSSSDGNQCVDSLKKADAFFSAVTSPSDIVHSFRDVFRNSCHLQDILSIENRLNQTKSNLRNSFERCDDEGVTKYKTDTYKLVLERQYVRNLVDCKKKVCTLQSGDDLMQASQSDIESELKDKKYVKDMGSELYQETLDEFASKYADRVETYRECQTSTDIANAFREWIDTVKTLFSDEGLIAREVKRQREQRENRETRRKEILKENPGIVSGIGNAEIKVQGVEPMKGLGQIVQNLKESAGSALGGTSGKSYDTVTEAIEAEQNRVAREAEGAEMLARYREMYAKGTDVITDVFINDLMMFDDVINDTFVPMDRIMQCTDRVVQRQCLNK